MGHRVTHRDHDRYLPDPFQIIFGYHNTTRHYVTQEARKILLTVTRSKKINEESQKT
jgi:hypothetical protein